MKIVKTSATTPEAPQRHFFSSKTERERGASRIGGAGERTAMSPSPACRHDTKKEYFSVLQVA